MNQTIDFFINWFTIGIKRSKSLEDQKKKLGARDIFIKIRGDIIDGKIDFDEKLLFKVVKTSFQQRRKTLRNSLKSLNIPKLILEDSIFDLRPEKLSSAQFIELTKKVGNAKI